MQKYPPLADAGRRARTPAAYHGIFDPFYRGAFDAGLPGPHRARPQLHARATSRPGGGRRAPPGPGRPGAVRRRRRDARLARRLRRTRAATWSLGPRTGYADQEARARARDAARRASPRPPASGTTSSATSRATSRCEPRPAARCDLPERRGGDPLGGRPDRRRTPTCSPTYDHPHFGRWPAVTTRRARRGPGHLRRHGAGRRPRPRPSFDWAVPGTSRQAGGTPPRSVTRTGATARDGRSVCASCTTGRSTTSASHWTTRSST